MSRVRKPRPLVVIEGNRLSPIECSVNLSLHQSADTFYARLPLDNNAGLDETYWMDTAPILITILGTNDAVTDSFTTLLTGQVDESSVDFSQRVVLIRGRDLTAQLIDLKTDERWLNTSNEDIISQLAERVGLNVKISEGADKAGLQFDQDYNEISDSDSCWNVIVACAKRLGCIAFVKGQYALHPAARSRAGDFLSSQLSAAGIGLPRFIRRHATQLLAQSELGERYQSTGAKLEP